MSANVTACAQDEPQDQSEVAKMRNTIEHLTAEVERLKRKIAELENDQHIDSLQKRLTSEEQRGETLQAQLREISEKEAGLQTRLDEIVEQLKPENIERMTAGIGSVRPEEARESMRHRLSNERHRIHEQLALLAHQHTRLQSSLATTDAAIERLRSRLNQAAHPF
jgi:chromosome segregation ATPase